MLGLSASLEEQSAFNSQLKSELGALQMGATLVPAFAFESTIQLPDEPTEASKPVEVEEVKAEDGDGDPDFGLTFTVPKVCLHLRTRKKAINSQGQAEAGSEWQLQTSLEQISVEMLQRKHGLTMRASVS